jgi:hypothetical protein
MAEISRASAAKMAHPLAQADLDQGTQAAAGRRHGHGGQDDDGDREHPRPPGEDDRAGLTGAAKPDDTSRPSRIYRSSPASSPSGPAPHSPLEVAMKARLTRLAYSLAALAALAAALGAGIKWR